jgi:hypothetical protein
MTTSTPTFRRGVFGLLALLLLLFGVNALYAPASQWEQPLTGQAGTLLYAAGFDGFTDEWQQSEGRDSHLIQDGHLRVSVGLDSFNSVYSATRPLFTDFDVSVNMTLTASPEDNDGAGVIFRLQEVTTRCTLPLVVLCQFVPVPADRTRVGYMFLISDNGFYSLWRSEPDGTIAKVTVWHNGEGIINTGIGATNRLRVVGRGDRFQFWINGTPLELCIPFAGDAPTGNARDCQGEKTLVWQDSTYATGKLGVAVNSPGVVVDFDDFIVFSPKAGDEREA